MTRTGLTFSLLWLAVLGAGCSSIHTTHVKRNEENCDWDTTHLRGIPITLDVPEKFKVEIMETQYFHTASGQVVRDGNDGKPVVTRNVTVKVVNKKEIFTVDFIKPGAGQLTTAVDLDSTSQYFSEINNKITDTTIDSITAAIGTIGGSISPLVGGKSTGFTPVVPDGLKNIDKTVAIGFFDVNDRHVVEKIHDFLCQHLNGCAVPCAVHAPPGIVGTAEFPPAPAPIQMPVGAVEKK